MTKLPKHCINALKYYGGQANSYTNLPIDDKAYNTLNSFFYSDINSERARVREGKQLNVNLFDNSSALLEFCSDLITATILGGEGANTQTVYRVSRYSDVKAMKEAGKTLTFTSTSKKGFLKNYADKDGLVLLELCIPANAPRADYEILITDYKNPDEAEVLLPPWLPAYFEKCEISDDEMLIKDRKDNPPVAKYRVQIGDSLVPPVFGNDCPMEIPPSDAGKRVLNALLNSREPIENDEKDYLNWKKALQAEITTRISFRTLSDVYSESLKTVQYITEDTFDNPFDADNGKAWIKNMLGVEKKDSFSTRIDSLTNVRISHTITTFLLGNWLRDRLHLDFVKLPRIFSKNNKVGDPFPFFWTIVCLGHDIGYKYETLDEFDNAKKHEVIETLISDTSTNYKELRNLLELSDRKTLLELDRDDLRSHGLTESECDWAERSIKMAQKYYNYRLNSRPDFSCIDHGIAGGIILFDILHEMADNSAASRSLHRHGDADKAGFAAASSRHSRFLACAILISLIVARHNMWVVDEKKPNDDNKNSLNKYRKAHLDELIVNGRINRLSIHEPLDQLLYFLDYMDTVDPFKAFYLRNINNLGELEFWKEFVERRIQIGFCRGEEGGSHRIRFCFDKSEFSLDSRPTIDGFSKAVHGMSGWLQLEESSVSNDDTVYLYLPVTKRKSCASYGYNVTEKEILDICFYQGIPDCSRPSAFFLQPNAYQSFNLLMMDGLSGEKVRIGYEHQRPNGIYIRYWRMTLEVFRNIFSAQCKCAVALSDDDNILHRMDREINAKQMCDMHRTYAFTSTTKAEVLPKFLEGKKNPIIESLQLKEKIPNFDFEQILKEDYVFTDETEVLLPPFIEIRNMTGMKDKYESVSLPNRLTIVLGNLIIPNNNLDKDALFKKLDLLKDEAAKTLDYFVSDFTASIIANDEDYPSYVEWKKAFQELVAMEFLGIYMNCNLPNQ